MSPEDKKVDELKVGMTNAAVDQNAQVAELGQAILALCAGYSLQTIMTVFVNLIGQIMASEANGMPAHVHKQVKIFSENAKRIAVQKLLYDNNQKKNQNS
jgi:hypothetical protein